MSRDWDKRRRVEREWDDGAGSESFHQFPQDTTGRRTQRGALGDVPGIPPGQAPIGFGERLAGRGRSGKRVHGRTISTRVLIVLSLLSIIMGFCCTQSALSLVDAIAAGRDAQARVAIIEGMVKGGDYFSADRLSQLQTHVTALNGDLSRLQSDLPWGVAHAPVGSSVAHMLRMSTNLVQAGHYALDAALMLVPHLRGMFSEIGSSTSTTPSGATAATTATASPTATSTSTSPNVAKADLTMDEVRRAQQDITTAGALLEQALAERKQVDATQLSHVGLGKLASLLEKLDALAPKMPTYLGYANAVANALPSLLGLNKTAHYLLFDLDSDELRPAGGFMGNYALLTVQRGHLVDGLHLKDVITLDCPNSSCPYNPIPPYYSWMNIAPSNFGMRDANLSPDYPTSARLVMQQYQRESGQTVDGVIMITPEIIKDILKVTGALKVTGFDQSVDANNLQDVIHFYHIQSGSNGVSPGSSGTTHRKVIDTLLGGVLLKKFAALDSTKQNSVLHQILQGVGTKDVQLYFVDPTVQAVLAGMHSDAAIPMPVGADGLMATDANVGATYYNSDLKETVADTISFDKQGDALHDTVITYHFQVVQHLYTPLLLKGNVTWYNDVVRIVVPEGSKSLGATVVQCPSSCYPVDAPEQAHQVWAMRIQDMQRGQTVVLHFKWSTPKALATDTTGNGTSHYALQLYRQAGNRVAYTIIIKPPAHTTIALPLHAPFQTPAGAAPGTAAQFLIPLLQKDTNVTLSFTNA